MLYNSTDALSNIHFNFHIILKELYYNSCSQCVITNSIQLNLDHPNSLGLDEIVRIIENMNINEEQKLITLT